MALDVNALVTQRDAIVAQLAALVAKPDYSIEGRSIQWAGLQSKLMDQLTAINKLIDIAEGPVEIHSEGFC
jgi:hypothetical protein